ncbi:MAG: RdgB/HAM1 family non-canonical purine NTP pyrophosphatase, partial [Clostridiales Family XIII bacterium]|nr:RdgB/HAM1 family non-canonical purine NTP pyrophosphatase [Clostridiales Family XIII bacterium]
TFGLSLISRSEAGLPDADPEETGVTFEENAFLKAKAAVDGSGMPAIADDSGLVVDALDGAPGVFSARFSTSDPIRNGSETVPETNNEKLLRLLAAVPDAQRGARFVCVIVLLWPDGRKIVCSGTCEGRIARKAAGENGFGYDPLFIPAQYERDGLTFAQIPAADKNKISHRAAALLKLKDVLAAENVYS